MEHDGFNYLTPQGPHYFRREVGCNGVPDKKTRLYILDNVAVQCIWETGFIHYQYILWHLMVLTNKYANMKGIPFCYFLSNTTPKDHGIPWDFGPAWSQIPVLLEIRQSNKHHFPEVMTNASPITLTLISEIGPLFTNWLSKSLVLCLFCGYGRCIWLEGEIRLHVYSSVRFVNHVHINICPNVHRLDTKQANKAVYGQSYSGTTQSVCTLVAFYCA